MYHAPRWTLSDLQTPISLFAATPPERWAHDRPVIMIGGTHGDEPLGVLLAEKTLEYLNLDAKKPRPEVTLPWILIPRLNVDGFNRGTRVNGRGVDLNRNYPARSWSPDHQKERYYPGPSAGSEAEVRAVAELIERIKPRLLIHFHSWHPMVVCTGAPGLKDAERLARSSGYRVEPEIGYPTPGSLSDFGWVDHHIPVICTEESDETRPDQTWPNFGPGLREILLDASWR